MQDAGSAKERLAFLDVARGLAALLVLLEHGLEACLPNFSTSTFGYGYLGKAGVILFLLISGFIIPASLEQGGSNARFWLRRLFRLFPAYWLSIALAYAWSWRNGSFVPAPAFESPGNWLINLTMLQGFLCRPHVWAVFWTLQLELVIYASCSILFAARLLGRSGWIAVLALAGFAVIGLGRPLLDGKLYGIAGQRVLYFAPLVGLVAQRYWAGRIRRVGLVALVLGQVITLAAIWSVNHALFPMEMSADCLNELAWTWGIAYAFFFALLALRQRRMPPAAAWLGRISYSVYLLHPFVLVMLIPTHWPAWALLPAVLAGTLALSDLVYRFVEVPGIALGRIVERRWLPGNLPGKREEAKPTVWRRAA